MTLPYILLSAVRDRLIAAIGIGLIAIWLVAAFAGSTSIAEEGAAATVFAGFGARLLVVFGIVLFVSLQVRRLAESGEMHVLLATPISRTRFVIQAWAGFAVLAIGFAVAAGGISALAGWSVAQPFGLAVWTGTLALEAVVMAAFALFVALGLRGMIAGLIVCLGFYALTRMLGVILAIARSEYAPAEAKDGVVGRAVDLLGLVLPRLDLLAESRWLVYGIEATGSVGLATLQAVAYTLVLVAAAVFDARGRAL